MVQDNEILAQSVHKHNPEVFRAVEPIRRLARLELRKGMNNESQRLWLVSVCQRCTEVQDPSDLQLRALLCGEGMLAKTDNSVLRGASSTF